MSLPEHTPKWRLTYPENLPITARRAELVELLRKERVVILAGDTGSGKTTQLPKLCLEAGAGVRGRIACTQPRRVAALSVSRRVAEELGVTWGVEVGCRIRFEDRTGPQTRIKFLTDGMLLAEAQGDPMLSDYDTIIVDEAHERSLNIDFLLGLLRRLLEKRPDLRVVVTSATIDTAVFSKAFGGAPVVEVSGRTYPVDVVYAPVDEILEESGEFTLVEAVASAVVRVAEGSEHGDILVFLATERDIREVSDVLRGRLPKYEVLPLFGRLSSGEQQRVFATGGPRKVVVATNIAETSLTIPGIRYVVDSGEARIARFNPRTRTKRLPVEKISRSSADQRKGRCGRVQDGICVRLYSESDYNERPRFTQPEIQRCNLAEVILRMTAAGWGEPEDFPFIDPPLPGSIQAGRQLLEELGAIDGSRRLTPLGRELSRLPIDPVLARMLLQARREHALREVLVIASALSVPDPRERPQGEEAKADTAHGRFTHPESDFLTLLAIWEAYHGEFETLSHSKLRRFCKAHYLSFIRMREWMDLHAQLQSSLSDIGGFNLDQGAPEADENARAYGGSFYRAIHRSLIPGLLANVGRHEDGPWYRVSGDRKAMLFPGSGVFQRTLANRRPGGGRQAGGPKPPKPPEWILAAEIVETSRLYARSVARIDPDWLMDLGSHVVRISHSDPNFLEEGCRVVVKETARLHGLEIRARAVDYGRIDPDKATEIFIREALVGERINSPLKFIEHNRRIRDKVVLMRTKLPGVGLEDVDEAVYRFYRSRIPQASSIHDLNRLWKERAGADPEFLNLTEEVLLGDLHPHASPEFFPDTFELGNSAFPIDYAYSPGDERDGVTIKVPVQRAKLLDEGMLDWLVPALLPDKVECLLRLLPKAHRVALHPVQATAKELAARLKPAPGGLAAAIAAYLERERGIRLSETELAALVLPEYLRTRVEVLDAKGRVVSAARDLRKVEEGIKAHERRLSEKPDSELDAAWRAARAREEKVSKSGEGWIFGDIPACLEVARSAGVPVRGYPGLRVEGEDVALRLFRTEAESRAGRVEAVARLLRHELRHELAYAAEDLHDLRKIKLALIGFAPVDKLTADAIGCLERHLLRREVEPLTAERFNEVAARAKAESKGIAYKLMDAIEAVLAARSAVLSSKTPYAGMDKDVARIAGPDFLARTPFGRLGYLPRYLKAIGVRAERARTNPSGDADKAAQVRKAEEMLANWMKGRAQDPSALETAEAFRWMLEEFRVSVFAQQLGTPVPVSLVRLERLLTGEK
jgi:ATP-dependent helicase HrpA